MNLTSWLIDPRDPLVVRDGRPNSGRSESRTREFPLPSTIAGGVRTRLGSTERGFDCHDRIDELLAVPVRGPLLVDASNESAFFFPAPSDAVLFDHDGTTSLHGLRPTKLPDDVRLDPDLGDHLPLVLEDPPSAKPNRELSFWSWADVEDWLSGAFARGERATKAARVATLLPRALRSLERERRTHVAIAAETSTAADGQLFETEGLRLRATNADGTPIELALRVDAGSLRDRELRSGLAPLGGERRLVHWKPTQASLPPVPTWLREHVRQVERPTLRVLLTTPAIFEGGFRPGTRSPLLRPREGLVPTLIAASVGSPMTVSGWSLRDQKPKPSRRAAAAGSVYWIELTGDAEARLAWLEEVWMQNVSCDEQDRRDGWGLALVGVTS